ncbi:MAG: type III secretion system inner membrane ring subunit SctD [Chlamydiales bacterium]
MNAEFVAEEGVLKGLILSLEDGQEWSFGSDPDQVTIVIEDPKVSPKHFICYKTPEGYFIENLSQESPTLLNNAAFSSRKQLQAGDKVGVGKTIFQFYPEGALSKYAFEPEYAFESETPFLDSEEEGEPFLKEEDKNLDQTSSPVDQEEIDEEEENRNDQEESRNDRGIEYSNDSDEEIAKEAMEDGDAEYKEELSYPIDSSGKQEDLAREEIFRQVEDSEVMIDLTPTTRFLIKVISGPNTGAEFALELEHKYLIGTDSETCDLVFNDLSVSREHARLLLNEDGEIFIEDLGSRNGVIVDNERIVNSTQLFANVVVALGTSAFLLIDKEAPSETIVTQVFETSQKKKEEVLEEGTHQESNPSLPIKQSLNPLAHGSLILALFIAGLAVLFGIGMVSLLQTSEVIIEKQDYPKEIQEILKDYPAIQYTYNPLSGKLFLMGHVRTGVEMNELLYKIKNLIFIHGLENNIVNDEAVWQEMNILLSKISQFKGVSMHSPQAGIFIISGYLKTHLQASNLIDYLNINFNYPNLLENHVFVEEQIIQDVSAQLIQHGFGAVTPAFSTGELLLTGYINSTQTYEYKSLVDAFEKILGIRSIKNFVVAVSSEQGLIDLNRRYPNKYRVTGFSKHGDVNINVVINGRILTRGDQIDLMTITSIQPHAIFLEKDGLKYKIEYNK